MPGKIIVRQYGNNYRFTGLHNDRGGQGGDALGASPRPVLPLLDNGNT